MIKQLIAYSLIIFSINVWADPIPSELHPLTPNPSRSDYLLYSGTQELPVNNAPLPLIKSLPICQEHTFPVVTSSIIATSFPGSENKCFMIDETETVHLVDNGGSYDVVGSGNVRSNCTNATITIRYSVLCTATPNIPANPNKH